MKTKSIRIPNDLMSAVKLVEKSEKIEEATAMRKLMRIGFETYVANLYKEGKVTLKAAAGLLKMNQIEALDLFLELGIKGNLEASDVIRSLERFVTR
jgi:predicted HTH domain antitoxin